MYPYNVDIHLRIEARRRAEERQQAELWRLMRRGRQRRQSWLSRHGCWMLCRLGRALVRLGRQLESYGRPQVLLKNGS
jgi:hypothetical protein